MEEIIIIQEPVSRQYLAEIAQKRFGDLVKVVVDLNREIMAIGGELHADEEAVLLEQGSHQADLWGINLYPAVESDDWIEFDSMINIRRPQNSTRGVEDPSIREKIATIVGKLLI